eukprot:scaffold13879_cov142-Isochrysis_galbana.AAC.4
MSTPSSFGLSTTRPERLPTRRRVLSIPAVATDRESTGLAASMRAVNRRAFTDKVKRPSLSSGESHDTVIRFVRPLAHVASRHTGLAYRGRDRYIAGTGTTSTASASAAEATAGVGKASVPLGAGPWEPAAAARADALFADLILPESRMTCTKRAARSASVAVGWR